MNDDTTASAADLAKDDRLRITEIYASVQGESTHAGRPCVFVRLTGCNLRCTWCDSVYTFTGGTHRTVDDVVAEAHALGIRCVEVTGGEPLVQRNAIPLMEKLLALGHEVLLETSGSRTIEEVPRAVVVILDLKPPGSGEVAANLWSNIPLLLSHHEVKFVVADRVDYEWARDVMAEHDLASKCHVLIGPAHGLLDPKTLVGWMLEDGLDARLNLQQHKYIWDATTPGV